MTVARSPFKFLDAYGNGDTNIFFGRQREIDALFEQLTGAKLVVVYGASGIGKTSLIQCGLQSRYRDVDWLPVWVRRDGDINAALRQRLAEAADKTIAADAEIVGAARSVFRRTLRPPFLIFDQFEEIFVLGSEDERRRFFTDIAALIGSDVSCRVILSLREDYIAQLSNYEEIVPTLFETRLRIEAMGPLALTAVISGTLAHFGVTLEHGPATARRIIERLGSGQSAYQLVYLQVYLDQLYRRAATGDGPVVITDALVDRTGTLETVLASFLEEQIAAAQAAVDKAAPGTPKTAVATILGVFVSSEGTKQPRQRSDLAGLLSEFPAPVIDTALAHLCEGRILRQAGDRFEIAHDTLAARIDSLRTADERHLNAVRRIVEDGVAKQGTVKIAWLADEDLATVLPVLPQLRLPPDQTVYVEKSRRYRRARHRWRVGRWVVLSIVLAVITVVAFIGLIISAQTVADANNSLNELTKKIYGQLRNTPGSEAAIDQLFELGKTLNSEIVDIETGDEASRRRVEFWPTIRGGDAAYDGGDLGKAAKLFDKAAEDARLVYEEEVDTAWLSNRYFALSRRLFVMLANMPQPVGKTDLRPFEKLAIEAEQVAEEVVALRNDEDPLKPQALRDARADLAEVRVHRARVHALKGDRGAARAALEDAVAIYRDLIPGAPKRTELSFGQVEAQYELALLVQQQAAVASEAASDQQRRELEQGRAAATQALAVLDTLLARQPSQLLWRGRRIDLLFTTADLNFRLGPAHYAEAHKLCDVAGADVRKLNELDPRQRVDDVENMVRVCRSIGGAN